MKLYKINKKEKYSKFSHPFKYLRIKNILHKIEKNPITTLSIKYALRIFKNQKIKHLQNHPLSNFKIEPRKWEISRKK